MVPKRGKCDSSAWVPLFHRNEWKGHSANFAGTAFFEIRQEFIGNSSPPASVATLYIQVEAKKSAS